MSNNKFYDPQNLPEGEVTVVLKGSEPSETKKDNRYGCEVCVHLHYCEPTPFGICKHFEKIQPLRKGK